MRLRIVLGGGVLAVIVSGCLDLGTPPATSPAVEALAGAWVFHVAGGRFADHVQLLLVDVMDAPDWPLRITPLQTRDWTGAPTRDFECVVCVGRSQPFWAQWSLRLSDGDSAVMRYDLRGDTATGYLTLFSSDLDSAGPYPVLGIRIDSAMLAPRSPFTA